MPATAPHIGEGWLFDYFFAMVLPTHDGQPADGMAHEQEMLALRLLRLSCRGIARSPSLTLDSGTAESWRIACPEKRIFLKKLQKNLSVRPFKPPDDEMDGCPQREQSVTPINISN